MRETTFSAVQRSLRVPADDKAAAKLIKSCFAELESAEPPRFRLLPEPGGLESYRLLKINGGYTPAESGVPLLGKSIVSRLEGCTHAALMVCTLGQSADRLLRLYQAADISRALVLDACANAYIEEVCDTAQELLNSRFPEYENIRRFSPGYGDLPLEIQPLILKALDRSGLLGITVNENYLMFPSKTVTAVIGLRKAEGNEENLR